MSRSTLDRAKAGDEQSFAELVAPHTHELRLHCYRMLGSLTDAEDALQEILTSAWRGLPGFEERASLRTWLYRIATNHCLNLIRDTARRQRPEPVPPFEPPPPTRRGDITWLQPCPDTWLDPTPGPATRYEARETVELAFITTLQRLPPRQTATVLLRDVLGFTTTEVATMLNTTPTSVKGVLQRARAALKPATTPAAKPTSAEERRLATRFAKAFSTDDIDGLITLLTDDAWLTMPPAPHEYHGPQAIAAFLHASATWRVPRRLHLLPTRANAQPAFGVYFVHPATPTPLPTGLIVLTLTAHHISGITQFLDYDLPHRFDLPA